MKFKSIKEPYYKYYTSLVGEASLIMALEGACDSQIEFFKNIDEEVVNYRYAAEKWSIKEVLQHLIDTERIFAYRALTILREDNADLPGYDHEAYVDVLKLEHVLYDSLIAEYRDLKQSNLSFLKNIKSSDYNRVGTANGVKMSIEDIGRMLVGHALHHIGIIKERYL